MTSTFILKQFDYSLSISIRDSLPLNLLRFLLVVGPIKILNDCDSLELICHDSAFLRGIQN